MSIKNKITILLPGKEPAVYDLDSFNKELVRMGRGPYHGGNESTPNDISVDMGAAFVSRAQCTFLLDSGRWYLADDNSKNGLTFQGEKISSRELHDGDKIYIGESIDRRLVMMYARRNEAQEARVEKFPLRGSSNFMIGRDSNCDIVINHPMVSRRHCEITHENGRYYISDNNSTNGVILNGRLLEKKEQLNQMDKISIADTSLFFCDGCLYFNEPTGGVSVSTEHLYKRVGKKGKEKYITNDVTLSIEPNEFVAIVGGSGAGKTTLLNCLSGLTDFTSGEVLVNGEYIRTGAKSLRSLMGYVPQQDIVYDTLTLERMLFYSAQLRMPYDTSAEEIWEKIDETLKIVELTEHRETLISKLSGGQKKRASIAVELLASPKLFFLDEPSSGLDPGTEKHLMQMLKRLSESGKTVVMVTHTVQNIDMCDRLICMGKGGLLCYSGPPSEALSFFGKERMTDIYDDLNENSEEMAEKFKQALSRQEQESNEQEPSPSKNSSKKSPAVLFRQFTVMTRRYAEIMLNSRGRLILLLLMPVVLALLVCISFQADGNTYKVLGVSMVRESFPFLSSSDTMSLLFAFSCAVFWIGIFNSVQEISKERTIYEREEFSGVAVLPYVLSKFVILTLLCLIQAVIMTAILVWLSHTTAVTIAGQESSRDMVFGMGTDGVVLGSGMLWMEFFLTVFLCSLSAMCLGLAISAIVSNEMALVICPLCLLPQILFSGLAGPLTGISEAISKIISCRWSCIAFFTSAQVTSMYTKYEYTRETGWDIAESATQYMNSAYEMDTPYMFGMDPVTCSWVALLLICIVCVVIAGAVLRLRRNQIR